MSREFDGEPTFPSAAVMNINPIVILIFEERQTRTSAPRDSNA